ncbi:hypothetical protein IE53DRAFT_367155 [Violaceomyces palustris]|uniref:Uncharacterized protein n=1 Tax=Violaceomyces palustris TaxID=1673888 RepID=A0ACD0P362_9BASI|nr:hypothetical protein IE53DRAFT_367155 [Violaceomyces palustris]
MSYQAPRTGAQGGPVGAFSNRPPVMEYICAECSATNEIRPREPIRCRECGHRVMYKKRTKRMLILLTSSCTIPQPRCTSKRVESHGRRT